MISRAQPFCASDYIPSEHAEKHASAINADTNLLSVAIPNGAVYRWFYHCHQFIAQA